MSANGTAEQLQLLMNGECKLGLCPIQWAQVEYDPSLAGNAFYLALFGLGLVAQIGLGICYRTWTFMGCMIGGLVLEVIGYVSRVQMSINPFDHNAFLIYIITLTIAPVFFAAAIYFTFGYVHLVYGPHISRFSSKTYKIIFISCDIFSLVLQSIGGGIANTANTESSEHTGVHIMVAGLAFQVFSLSVFMALSAEFFLNTRRRASERSVEQAHIRETKLFKNFLIAYAIATVAIFVRSIFRVAELNGGFNGKLANDQVTFMILEGGMISIAVILMTVFHPGSALKDACYKRSGTKA